MLGPTTTTCENCGSFVPLEEVSAIGQFVRSLFGKRLNELTPQEIAFWLACVPLLLGPPVAAIILVGVKVFQDRSRLQMTEWQKPLAIALINILISVLIWRYVANQATGQVSDLIYWIRNLFEFRPGGYLKPIPV